MLETSLTRLRRSRFSRPRSPPRRTLTSSSMRASKGPGVGKHIVFLAGDHEYRSEESLPELARILAKRYGVQVQRLLHRRSRDRVHRSRQLEDRRPRGARNGRPDGRLPALPGLPRRPRCSTSPTTSIAADRSSAFRTATHAFQIKRPDAKFVKYDWQNKDELRRRVRPSDPRRDVGVALRHESQAELAADPRSVAGRPSRAARREGRVGAVGRIHGRSAAAEHDPRARSDPERHDAGLAAGRRQAADAGRVGAHLHRRVGQGRAASSRRRTARRRIC